MAPREFDEGLLRAKAKKEIRRSMRALRKAVPKAARAERSRAIAARVVALPEFERARVVAAYVPVHAEADPSFITTAAWAVGKRVVLPRVDFDADAVVFHEHEEGAPLEENGYGILEPSRQAPLASLEAIDLVLVPALAADPRGHRIGYGKGFYDRLLPSLPNATRVVLAFDFQLHAEIPNEPNDVPVDLVVTDARVLRAER